MSSPFSRSLRALESERSRGWRTAAAASLLLLGWVSWFILARVPLYETSTFARLEATAAAHPVDARMLGRVVSVNLTVGRIVRSGDILIELEADAERLALGEARRRLEALGPQIAAVRQEIAAEEQAVDADRRAGLMARDEQRAALRQAEASLGLANEEARQLARLRADGIVSEIENSRARAEAERRKAMADAAIAAIARIETDQTTRESDRRVRIQRLRGTLTQLEGNLATAGAAAKRSEYEVERRVLRAPIDGRIAEAADLRVGAVVDEGNRLAAIVPASPLRIVAQFAPASAIGRVRVGQPARVRLLGFPWAEYGSLQAQVTAVAGELRDGLVRVELGVGSLPAAFPLTHALPGSVEIEVERVRPAWLVFRSLGGLLTRPVESAPRSTDPHDPRPVTSVNPPDPRSVGRDPRDPRPVTSVNPRDPRPVTSVNPHDPRPVTSVNPRDPRPVTSVNPRDPRPVTSLNPRDPRPVTSVNPRDPRPVTSVNPRDPRPVTSLNPRDPRPVTSLNPRDPRPVTSVNPRDPRPVTSLNPRDPRPVTSVNPRDPRPMSRDPRNPRPVSSAFGDAHRLTSVIGS